MLEKSCRVFDMGYKEVINLHDGARLGYVGDVDIDLESGRVTALIIPGRLRFFGLFGREDDYVIPWESIEKIGEAQYGVQPSEPAQAWRAFVAEFCLRTG